MESGATIFISYSHADKIFADAVCSAFEGRGVGCWIAPRNIVPGTEWAQAIIEALDRASAMVLVFSAGANDSPQVIREAERAVHKRVPIVPVRVEDVMPTGSMEYFLSAAHWLDVFAGPPSPDHQLDRHLARIVDTVGELLAKARPGQDTTWAASSEAAAGVAGAVLRPGGGPPRPELPPRPALPPRSAYTDLVTEFVGRDRDLADLRLRLARPRLQHIAVVGPAGVGKTRLALELAYAVESEFRDGVYFVAARDLTDVSRLPELLLRALRPPAAPLSAGTAGDLRNELAFFLSRKDLLVVLDHVDGVPGVYPWVADVLGQSQSPRVRIVTTSAVWSAVDAYEVRPLPVPPPFPTTAPGGAAGPPATPDDISRAAEYPAVRLFCDRAVRAKAGFALSAANVADVVALVRRWDGLPLAVELIAARVRHRTPRQLLAESPGRTLDDAIDAAVRGLDPVALGVFCRASVFRGGFLPDAVAAVAAAPIPLPSAGPAGRDAAAAAAPAFPSDPVLADDVDAAVAVLQDRSLLAGQEDGAWMRWFLLEPIRCRAAHWAVAANPAAVEASRRAHAAWYLGLASRLTAGPDGDQADWAAADAERANFAAALQFARDTGNARQAAELANVVCPLLARRGYWADRLEFARAAWQAVDGRIAPDGAAARAELMHQLGNAHHDRWDLAAAEDWYKRCLEARRAAGDDAGMARTYNRMALVADGQRRLADADALATEALGLMRAAGDKAGEADVLNNLGKFAQARAVAFGGDDPAARDQHFATAEGFYKSGLALCNVTGDDAGVARGLNNLAVVAYLRGDKPAAAQSFQAARARYKQAGDRAGEATAAFNAALVANARKQLPEARAAASDALRIAEALSDVNETVAKSLALLGNMAYDEGRLGDAVALLGRALAASEVIGSPGDVIDQAEGLAEAVWDSGDRARGRALLGEAIERAVQAGDKTREDRLRQVAASWADDGRVPPTTPPSPPTKAGPARYPGTTKVTVCDRLVGDWARLADALAIPASDRAGFEHGREPHAVWDWLERRERLDELEDGLSFINRLDLVEELRRQPSGRA